MGLDLTCETISKVTQQKIGIVSLYCTKGHGIEMTVTANNTTFIVFTWEIVFSESSQDRFFNNDNNVCNCFLAHIINLSQDDIQTKWFGKISFRWFTDPPYADKEDA